MALTESQRSNLRRPIRWLRNPEPEHPDEIPRRELSSLTFALTGQNHIFSMAASDRFVHFCTNVLKIDPVHVGFMVSATAAFDAINDPLAGAIVDRYRFKDGRKLLPWLKFTSPLIAIFAFLLFINWGLSYGLSIFYAGAVYVMWDIAYSFHDAALWGMTAAIHPNSRQSARTVQWADFGVFAGGLLPGLTMPMLGGGGAFGLSQQQVYFIFGLFLCLGGGLLTLFALQMKERVRSLPEAEEQNRVTHPFKSVMQNIARIRHNHVLLLFLAARIAESTVPNVADIFMFQDMQPYNVFGSEIHPSVMLMIFTIIWGFPGAALKPFALKIADRVGSMKRILIIGRVTAIAARVLGFLVGVRTWPALVIVCLLDGISHLPNSLFNIAQRSMLSDSVDYVEWKTGQRTEAITMSIRNFMSKFGSAIRRFIQGYTLRFLQHNPSLTEARLPQNAHFQQWIWPVFRLGPAVGLIVSLIPLLLLNYPDSLKLQVETDLAQRRALAEEELMAGIAE